MSKTGQSLIVFWMAAHYWKRLLKYIGFGGAGRQATMYNHLVPTSLLVEVNVLTPTGAAGLR